MIQRIQSLYLLVAAMLIAALFFVPFAELNATDGIQYVFRFMGIFESNPAGMSKVINTWPVAVFVCLSLILLILAIFLYKNRRMQMRLSYLCFILLMVLKASIYYYTWSSSILPRGGLHAIVFAEFPTIAAVLTFLAIRGIRKDENLIKSIDRIR